MQAHRTKALHVAALSVLVAGAALTTTAQAQADRSFPPGTLTLERDPNDPSTLLNRYLRTLSVDPRNMDALIGAGRAALAMGDANAAIGFFGRGEAVSPSNGRVKAGLATAAVQQEQPRQALRLFDAAIAAGVPVAEIGGDRGLAYDLRGQNRLAQADYRAALAFRRDDEVTRRLALSTAIGGDRAGAMTILDPLLRRQDKAAWRAATFVLAMTGDTTGAVRRANQLMVPRQAEAMKPYLQRLAGLDAGQKAAAVHFGRFPTPGRPGTGSQIAAATPPAVPPRLATNALTPAGMPFGRSVPARPTPDPVTSMAARTFVPSRPAPAATALKTVTRVPVAVTPAASPAVSAVPTPTQLAALAAKVPVPFQPVVPVTAARVSAPPAVLLKAAVPRATAIAAAATVPPIATVALAPSSLPTAVAAVAPAPAVVQPTVSPVGTGALAPSSGAAAASTMSAVEAQTAVPLAVPVQTSAASAIASFRAPAAQNVASASATPDIVRMTTAPTPRPVAAKVAKAVPLAAGDKAVGRTIEPMPSKVLRTRPGKTQIVVADGAAEKPAKAVKAGKLQTATVEDKAGLARSGRAVASARVKAGRADTKLAAGDKAADTASKTKAETKLATKGKAKTDVTADAKTKTDGKAKTNAKAKTDKKATATAKVEERHWVQVAGGANKDSLPKAWAGVKSKYPALLSGKAAYTTPLRFTNRLLIGPFKSDAEAQAFVNKAGGAGLNAFTFKSDAGQDVAKLPSK